MAVDYFKHHAFFRNDQRLCDVGDDMGDNNLAYSLFWKTKELMAEKQEHYLLLSKCQAIAYYYRVSEDVLRKFFMLSIDRGLFELDGDIIKLDLFIEECIRIEDISAKRRISGKKGGETSHPKPIVKTKQESKPITERQNKTDYNSILDYWNSKNIVKHDKVIEPMKHQIDRRLKEYTAEQIKQSIDNYANAVLTDEFWCSRKKEWTLTMFLKQENAMPKFLTWEKKNAPNVKNDKCFDDKDYSAIPPEPEGNSGLRSKINPA